MARSKRRVARLIEERFPSLSPQLREAARFALDHPQKIALESMRSAAAEARVHPNSMLRLARELGFESYDPFREEFRDWLVDRGPASWTGRAQTLRTERTGPAALLDDILVGESRNLRETFGPELHDALLAAKIAVTGAPKVYILGLRSLFPVAFYTHYVCRMFMTKTVLLTGTGGTFADDLRAVEDGDVLLAFSHRPYARDALRAAEFARERGAILVAVTDSAVSPIARTSSISVVVSNATPSFFPSILPAMAVAQSLVALLVAESGEDTMAAIARSEVQLDAFGVYVK